MVTNLMKYNPAFLGDEALIRSFVARTSELERILEVLRENTTGANQHLLVIGPRGIGKTTLVLRVAAEIRADPALSAHWYPVVYGEETYQVSSAGEFWLEALFHVGQQTGGARWQQAHEELLGERNEKRLRPRALAQLMDFADEQGKRLVLVVENLNMLFGGQIGDEDAWVLRHTLMNEPRIMLIGTATSRFRVMDEYNQALYELFRIMELEPLADEDAHAVWTAATGQAVPRHQLRPIQILTGGNPRLIRILSEFAAKTSFRSLMDDLTRLVDEHTEYFKHHLDNLAPQERKVFVVLADLWDPSTTRQVAEAARLDVNVASVQLKRLVDRGAVTMPKKHGRTQFYQVAERMYNIYHLMRRRGQPSSRVHAVVRFMVSLYRDEELIRTTRSLAEEAARLTTDQRREHFLAYEAILTHAREPQLARQLIEATGHAFEAMPDVPSSVLRLIGAAALLRQDPASKTNLSDGAQAADLDIGEIDDVPTLLWIGDQLASQPERAEDAEAAYSRVLRLAPDSPDAWLRIAVLDLINDRYLEALEAFDRTVALDRRNVLAWTARGNVLSLLGRAEDALESLNHAVAVDGENALVWAVRGIALHGLGRADEALESFDRAVSIDANNATAWRNRGIALNGLGRLEEALESFNRAVAIDTDDASTWRNRGIALNGLRRLEEALESFDRAVAIDTDDASTWRNRGNALIGLRRLEEALESLDRAVAIDADDASTWRNRGIALNDLRRLEEALESFDRAVVIDANNAVTWRNRGVALNGLSRFEEAVESYDRAVALNTNDAFAWRNRGIALSRLGRVEEALESFDRAVAIDPNDASTWRNRGIVLGSVGRVEEALESFDRAVVIDPNDAFTWRNRGLALTGLGRLEEALESSDRAVAIDANGAIAWRNRGIVLGDLGRSEEALQSFDRAVAINANDALTWRNRGIALGSLGRFEEALESLDRALAINANDALTWRDRGFALYGLGRVEESLESSNRAVAINANDETAWWARGVAFDRLERLEEALESFDRALALNEMSVVTVWNRILVLLKLNRIEEAIESLECAMTLLPSTSLVPYDALNAIAWSIFKKGLGEKLSIAESCARLAVDQAPESGGVRHTLACLLGAQGKWEQALDESAVFLRDRELLDANLEDVIDFFIDAAASGYGDRVSRAIRSAGAEDAFEPLLVAIRRLSGEQVDVAREIMEISTDVIERVETRHQELRGG